MVDNYVKIESQKLRWMQSHQNQIRSDLYDGLQDSVHMGINNAGTICKKLSQFPLLQIFIHTQVLTDSLKNRLQEMSGTGPY